MEITSENTKIEQNNQNKINENNENTQKDNSSSENHFETKDTLFYSKKRF